MAPEVIPTMRSWSSNGRGRSRASAALYAGGSRSGGPYWSRLDEDEALGNKSGLTVEPILALLYDISGFFARDAVPDQEATDRSFAEHQPFLARLRRSSSIERFGVAFSIARIVSLCPQCGRTCGLHRAPSGVHRPAGARAFPTGSRLARPRQTVRLPRGAPGRQFESSYRRVVTHR